MVISSQQFFVHIDIHAQIFNAIKAARDLEISNPCTWCPAC